VKSAIGIDIGGTKTAIGIVDTTTGKILQKQTLNTPAGSGLDAVFLHHVAEVVHTLERLPVGIGICELVDTRGSIVSQSRFNWTTADIRNAFYFAPSFKLESDVRAAALAEGRFGAGVGFDHWIYVNAGTGIATVLMQDGKPYVGTSGLGMAFGMSPSSLVGDQPQPTIEDLAGAKGMICNARKKGLKVESLQDLIDVSPDCLSQGGQVLGRAIGTLANMLDPQTIVLGGGVAHASKVYRKAFEDGFNKTVWFTGVFRPEVIAAKLNVDSGLIGAGLRAVGK
jgi:glucokinase